MAFNLPAVVNTLIEQTTQGAMRATGLGIPIAQGNLAWTSWTLSGAYTCTFTLTNNTSVTFPLTGTLATLAGAETLASKTLTAPVINAYTMTGTGTIGAGCTLTSPVMTAPTLGVATATSYNGLTITATTGTLTMTNGKTLAVTNSITLSGTDSTVITLPSVTSTLYGTGTASITAAQLLASLATKTGTGVPVFATSPTLVTPVLGVATGTSLTLSGTLAVSGAMSTAGINGMVVNATSTELQFANASLTSCVFTLTGDTALTLPESGTLATLAGAEALSSKTITASTFRKIITAYNADGAIAIQGGIAEITKGSIALLTLAAPSGVDGTEITISSNSNFAHVVTFTGTTLYDGTSGANLSVTFAAFSGASITVYAYGSIWKVKCYHAVTIAP